jgi:hypothetical protein
MKKLLIIFAVLCLAAPAMAADWNFYGSARMATFYSIVDKDLNNDNDTVNRTQWDQQTNSRLGATVKVNDQIGGGFEYGTSGGNANIRKLYGTYIFGGGSELLLGQTYVPTGQYFYSNSVFDGDGDLLGVGQFYTGRVAMVQWKTGGLKLAAVKANTPDDAEAGTVGDLDPNGAGYAVDLIIPKLEASYGFKGDAWFMDLYGGFQTYGLDYFEGNDPTITSWVGGVGGGMTFGAFYLNLGGHYAQNAGAYGAYGSGLGGLRPINDDYSIDANQNEIDNTGYGFLAVLGFNLSDTMTIEGGGGYEYAELDVDGPAGDGESVWQVYINSTINIAPGFFVVPEIGYASYDYATVLVPGQDEPKPNIFYAGAKWQINF